MEKEKNPREKNKEIGKKKRILLYCSEKLKPLPLQVQTKWQLLLTSLSGDRDS